MATVMVPMTMRRRSAPVSRSDAASSTASSSSSPSSSPARWRRVSPGCGGAATSLSRPRRRRDVAVPAAAAVPAAMAVPLSPARRAVVAEARLVQTAPAPAVPVPVRRGEAFPGFARPGFSREADVASTESATATATAEDLLDRCADYEVLVDAYEAECVRLGKVASEGWQHEFQRVFTCKVSVNTA